MFCLFAEICCPKSTVWLTFKVSMLWHKRNNHSKSCCSSVAAENGWGLTDPFEHDWEKSTTPSKERCRGVEKKTRQEKGKKKEKKKNKSNEENGDTTKHDGFVQCPPLKNMLLFYVSHMTYLEHILCRYKHFYSLIRALKRWQWWWWCFGEAACVCVCTSLLSLYLVKRDHCTVCTNKTCAELSSRRLRHCAQIRLIVVHITTTMTTMTMTTTTTTTLRTSQSYAMYTTYSKW